MEIRSSDGKSYVSLTGRKVDDYAVMAAIAVQDLSFAGAYDKVGFFRDAFAAFIRSLEDIADEQEGEARLESMSPEEAILSIRPIRRFGVTLCALVEVQVGRWHYVCDRQLFNRVSVAFELAPSLLPDVVRSLAAVITEAEPS